MKKVFVFLAALLFTWTGSVEAQDNQLTAKEKKEGWVLLFNGKNLDGWTSVGKDVPPAFGWEIENGVMTVRKQDGKRGGDIITRAQYSDFDLKVDFRITKGANSGIKYFFTKYEKGGWLGLEYQIMDDENHPDGKLGGEWNQARIVAKGSKVTHYLNGKKILTFDRSSQLYKETWQLSKYKNCQPMFGDVEKGHILLQDHGDVVSFKNVKIRKLK